MGRDNDSKVIKRQEKSKFETHNKVILESVGEKSLNKIPLDFSLIPEKLTKFETEDIVQIYGECLKCDGKAMLQVHIIRYFGGVNVEKYHKAVSEQSLACPRMNLRKHQLDSNFSP